MGLLIGWLARHDEGYTVLRHAAVIGFLGSFTTFSTFSLDVVTLAERGQMMAAALYAAASFVLAVGALVAGLAVMRAVA
jgi:CrcB protein